MVNPTPATQLSAPTPEAAMHAAFRLAKELSVEMREEELVGTFMQVIGELLPGRFVCLRVTDPRDHGLTSLLASGPLQVAPDEAPLELKRSSVRATGLAETALQSGSRRVQVVERYQPIFRGTHAGFAVPLVAARQLHGLLNVEYPHTPGLAASDEPLAIALANQLSVALRGVTLLHEARTYRDYLRQLLEVAAAFIVSVDKHGRIAVINRALQTYLGRSVPVGAPLVALGPLGEQGLASFLKRALAGNERSTEEIALDRGDGVRGFALFNTALLHGPDGQIEGVIAIGQERDRIRSLERQIVQTEKLATLGQLAAGLVHELNNPLTSINVYGAYFVQHFSRLGAESDLERARKIVDGAARIERLSRELMSYARPSAAFESTELNEVVRQAAAFCEHVIADSNAILILELDPELPSTRTIPSQIQQVLINLVTNACHALGDSERVVRVRTARGSDGKFITLEVIDSGVGIDTRNHARVFEPFFTTKSEGRGSGLGLSIVRHIVEAHDGSITFDSRPGQGTRFVISLPLPHGE